MNRRPKLCARLIVALACAMSLSACKRGTTGRSAQGIGMRDGQPVARRNPTPLYTPKFVIRGLTADGEHLYVSGLRLGSDDDSGEGSSPTGLIVKIPLLGVPEVLAEGAFVPMTTLRLIGDRLYWHERYDSPDGRGLRSLSTDGGDLDRISDRCGHSWVIGPEALYFTRPDDEIDEGGFYVLEHGQRRPKLVARRRGVARTLLATDNVDRLYWTTRARRDGTWAVYEWDHKRSGKEVLSSDETFASIVIQDQEFLWVTWAEDEGEPLHSLYRRPLAGGEVEVLARKRGLPGFMEVFADDENVYLTTVRGGELRRLPRAGGELEILEGSGDRRAIQNHFNLFWVEDQQVFWMRK